MIEGPWRHRDIAANGARFHVVVGEHFEPTAPLVVLLHGFCQFWWAWRHQIPALDAAGFSVAALDLRGYGASDKTPRGYDPETTASDVAGVIKSLGFADAYVVGHDWGAIAGWSTTAYAPTQVRALASLAAPHPLAFPWRHHPADWAFFQLPLLPERRLMASDGIFVERWLRRWAARPDFLTAEEAQPYRNALRHWPSPHCALKYQRVLVRNRFWGTGRDYRRALAVPVGVPVLSVHGQQDALVPLRSMAAAERYVTGPHELVSLPATGHLPHEEDPNTVNQLLTDWLARTP